MAWAIAEAREVLRATPAVLRALLSGVSDAWVDANEGPDTASASATP